MVNGSPPPAHWTRVKPILLNFLLHRAQSPKFRGIGTTLADITAELHAMDLYVSKGDTLAFLEYLLDVGEIFYTIDEEHYNVMDDAFTLIR